MGCFDAPFLSGNGERLFAPASPYKMTIGPFTARADGIKDEHKARAFVAQVIGVIRSLEVTATGRILVSSIASFKKQVLVFPYLELHDDDGFDDGLNTGPKGGQSDMAWTDPRMGLFSVAVSFTPLFGQSLKVALGADPSTLNHVFSPQEVLMHEFVHVAREVSGNWKKMDPDDEEGLGVLITNLFSQEIKRDVVTNYLDQDPVTIDLRKFSNRIYQDEFDMIATFFKQNRPLAMELARVNVAFNPLRQYADENL